MNCPNCKCEWDANYIEYLCEHNKCAVCHTVFEVDVERFDYVCKTPIHVDIDCNADDQHILDAFKSLKEDLHDRGYDLFHFQLNINCELKHRYLEMLYELDDELQQIPFKWIINKTY